MRDRGGGSFKTAFEEISESSGKYSAFSLISLRVHIGLQIFQTFV